jgi:single-stranded DNA-binding protein
MSTPPYPTYPTHHISSSALHLITGRLGDDPVACATQRNTSMTIFSVKVVRRSRGEYHTTWYRIKTYGALADACLTYLHRDRLVQVQGHHLAAWAFTDPATGKPRATLELVATNVTFLDDPNIHLAAMNILPTGDIPFSKVPEPAGDRAEAEELAVAG